MITEARLIVPHDLPDELVRQIEDELVDIAGGLTRYDGIGSWFSDDGAMVREAVYVYDIATEWSDDQTSALRALARKIAIEGNQTSVYMRRGDGGVEFISATSLAVVDNLTEASAADEHARAADERIKRATAWINEDCPGCLSDIPDKPDKPVDRPGIVATVTKAINGWILRPQLDESRYLGPFDRLFRDSDG